MNQNSPLSFSNIFKRETKLAAYFIICLTLVVLSVSYALFFSVDNNSNNQEVTAGDLKFTYSNSNTITSAAGNNKNNICFQPMSEEEAELYWNECSYKFSVTNTGTLNSTYSLSLSAMDGNTIEESKLKVILRKENGESEHERVEEYKKAKSISELTTKGEESKEYSLLENVNLNARGTAVYEVQIYVDESQFSDGYGADGQYSAEKDDSKKTINFQINGKGIVNESTDLNPDKPFESPLDNPTQQVDETTGNGLYEVKHEDLTADTDGGGS